MTASRALAARWHHLTVEAADVVHTALDAGVPVQSLDVSPAPSILTTGQGAGYPEIIVSVPDDVALRALARLLGFPPPGPAGPLEYVRTASGDRRGVRIHILSAGPGTTAALADGGGGLVSGGYRPGPAPARWDEEATTTMRRGRGLRVALVLLVGVWVAALAKAIAVAIPWYLS